MEFFDLVKARDDDSTNRFGRRYGTDSSTKNNVLISNKKLEVIFSTRRCNSRLAGAGVSIRKLPPLVAEVNRTGRFRNINGPSEGSLLLSSPVRVEVP